MQNSLIGNLTFPRIIVEQALVAFLRQAFREMSIGINCTFPMRSIAFRYQIRLHRNDSSDTAVPCPYN